MKKYYKKDMESVLTHLSSTIPRHSVKLIFTTEEKKRLVHSPLFKAVSEAYHSEKLSIYGALAWFINQSIDLTINEVNNGKQLSKESQQIFYKLSHHALILEQKSPSLKTNKKDLLVIKKAAQTGRDFIDLCTNE
jgi:hypothetical protein